MNDLPWETEAAQDEVISQRPWGFWFLGPIRKRLGLE